MYDSYVTKLRIVHQQIVLPGWGGEYHGMPRTLYGYMMNCFSLIDLLSQYWRGGDRSRGQTPRMTAFMDTYMRHEHQANPTQPNAVGQGCVSSTGLPSRARRSGSGDARRGPHDDAVHRLDCVAPPCRVAGLPGSRISGQRTNGLSGNRSRGAGRRVCWVPVRFLSDARREQLSGFPAEFDDEALDRLFTLSDTDLIKASRRRGNGNRLG